MIMIILAAAACMQQQQSVQKQAVFMSTIIVIFKIVVFSPERSKKTPSDVASTIKKIPTSIGLIMVLSLKSRRVASLPDNHLHHHPRYPSHPRHH